jgi:hypothetical protein
MQSCQILKNQPEDQLTSFSTLIRFFSAGNERLTVKKCDAFDLTDPPEYNDLLKRKLVNFGADLLVKTMKRGNAPMVSVSFLVVFFPVCERPVIGS